MHGDLRSWKQFHELIERQFFTVVVMGKEGRWKMRNDPEADKAIKLKDEGREKFGFFYCSFSFFVLGSI